MPQALASVPFSSTEILRLIQIQGNQWKNLDGKFKNTASLVSFESEPTFLTSLGLEGLSKTVADHKVYTGLWLNYVLTVASRSSTSSNRLWARPRPPLLSALGNVSEMQLLTVPGTSSHHHWCWLCTALIRTVRALDKASPGSVQLFQYTETSQYLFQTGTLLCSQRWKRTALYKAVSINMGFHGRTKANDAIFAA